MSDAVIQIGDQIVEVTIGGGEGPKGDSITGPPGANSGTGANASTRSAVAGIVAPSANAPVILTEAGREGTFIFSTANLSTQVTADPQQAIYIAPTAAPTGASGAWVRERERNLVRPEWFGAVGNGVTDDTPAFVAMRTLCGALAINSGSGLRAGPEIHLGSKTYFLASSFDCKGFIATWRGLGAGFAKFNVAANTTIKMASGATFFIQRADTEGLGEGLTIPFGADSSVFHDIAFEGPGKGVGTASIVRMRARAAMYNCRFHAGGGYGLEISASAGQSANIEGNANLWLLVSPQCVNNGKSGLCVGRIADGTLASADVNAGNCLGGDFSDNDEFGIEEASFLGNTYTGCHSASNGLNVRALATFGGNLYSVVSGQEAGASTNAPSGTTADNSWWYYYGAGGSIYANAWTSGATYKAGGAYRASGANAANVFNGCYSESGQGPSQFQGSGRSVPLGGLHAAGVRGAGILGSDAGVLNAYGGFKTEIVSGGKTLRTARGADASAWTIDSHMFTDFCGGVTPLTQYFRSGVGTVTWGIGFGTGDRYAALNGNAGSRNMHGLTVAPTGAYSLRELYLGDGTLEGRKLATGTVAPTAGEHARGERVLKSDLTVGGPTEYLCTAGGTPGTHVASGIVGGVQAATQANSVATDVAGVVADLNALLAKLKAAKLMA